MGFSNDPLGGAGQPATPSGPVFGTATQLDVSQFLQMLGGQSPQSMDLAGSLNPSAMQLGSFLMNQPGASGQIPTFGTQMPWGLPMMLPQIGTMPHAAAPPASAPAPSGGSAAFDPRDANKDGYVHPREKGAGR